MATQQIKTTNYFSHDSNARNDERILLLRMKHGAAGYGVYFMLLERMRETSDYMSAKDYNMVAFDLRVDASVVKSVVEDFGLFAFTEDGKRFYSESFSRRMGVKDALKKKQEEGGRRAMEKRWDAAKRDVQQKEDAPKLQLKEGNNQYLLKFFAEENKESLDTLLKNIGLEQSGGVELLRNAAKEVVSEWELSQKQHGDYTDFSKHLIATLRIKLNPAGKQSQAQPQTAKADAAACGEADVFLERRRAFWKELCEIAKGKCPEDTLKAFFCYWSEPTAAASPEERKMRYELQRVWNTASRLAAWMRNERKPTTRAPSATTPANAAAAQAERDAQHQKREAEYADRKAKCVTREQYLEMVRSGKIAAEPTARCQCQKLE